MPSYSFPILLVLQLYSLQGGTSEIVIHLTGNQTVLEGSNVTFSCTVVDTSNNDSIQLRSNWFIIFPDDRQTHIRLQGGGYIPADTNRSLFHVPDMYPGFQETFTFLSINRKFNLVEVRCFNGDPKNSSFIIFYESFKFSNDTMISESENTTGFFPLNIEQVGDDVEINYKWSRGGVVLVSNERVQYLMTGINFIDGQGGMYRNDSAIYKLTISNIAGTAVTYFTLGVQYAPSIVGSGAKQELAFQIGQDEIVTCGLNSSHELFLDGNPFPSTFWYFDNVLITNTSKYKILDDSIIIVDVESSDAGVYNCTATNSIGSAVIIFLVEVFDTASSPQNVTVSSITNTTAVIMWEAPLFTDGLSVYNYIVHDFGTGMELGRTADNTTFITLTKLLPAINYSIAIMAVTRHRFGRVAEGDTSDVANFTTAMGKPVLDDMIIKTVDDAITISWTVVTNGGMLIVGYTVEWIVPGTNRYTIAPNGRISDGSSTYLRISFNNVLARQEYQYRIKAMNSLWRESSYIFTTFSSPKGLPARPSQPQVSTDIVVGEVVTVSTRTDVAGVDNTNTTLIFEVDAQNSFETITRNFSVVLYRVSSEVRFTFSGLRAGRNYTFRCRVFNIYGVSDYSVNSIEIAVSDDDDGDDDVDDENSISVVIIGVIAGGAVLLILVLLIIIIISYAIKRHKRNAAASYAINDGYDDYESKKDPAFSIQYADNPQYSFVQIHPPKNIYASDPIKSSYANGNSCEQVRESTEFQMSVTNETFRGDVDNLVDNSVDNSVAPPHFVCSNTMV